MDVVPNVSSIPKTPRLPTRVRLPRTSLAVRAAAFSVVGELLLVGLLVLVRSTNPNLIDLELVLTPARLAVVGTLLVTIPLTSYLLVGALLEARRSRYADVDAALRAGARALRAAGIEIDAVPVFVVCGPTSGEAARALFSASGLAFRLNGVPEGAAALQWYATENAVFVVCTGVGCASAVAVAIERLRVESGTTEENAGTTRRAASISTGETIEETRRLGDVVQYLASVRHPLCPVNGCLVVVPLAAVTGPDEEVDAVRAAVLEDTTVVGRASRLRSPATLLVSQCDEDDGFRELVRRVGPEGAVRDCIGVGFDLESELDESAVVPFSESVVGAIGDQIHESFRQPDVLTRPNNERLYALLCRLRTRDHAELLHVLSGAAATAVPVDQRPLFGGCFFAATGSTEDRQAFVQGVFEKLEAEQEELTWMTSATRDDRRWRAWGTVGLTLVVGLTVSLIVGIVFAMMPSQ